MILVVGATGQLGSKVVRGLIAKKEPVRILARPASAYQPLANVGAEVVFGDLADPPSLLAACKDIDTVISTANSARRGGSDTVETVDSHGTQSLIDAAAAAGVRHFIYVSVLGVNPNSPVPFLAAKARSGRTAARQRHEVDNHRAECIHGIVAGAGHWRSRERGPSCHDHRRGAPPAYVRRRG